MIGQQAKSGNLKDVSFDLIDEKVKVGAYLGIPSGAKQIVVFAHGSGSSRHSPRNQFVADQFMKEGLAVLLLDLLTPAEDARDNITREYRFNIPMLGKRLISAAKSLKLRDDTKHLKPGFFGASTGAAAALIAAAELGNETSAVVSRGGRPDLAMGVLDKVKAPTLFIIGGKDYEVIELNRKAFDKLKIQKRMEIVPGATHLFEEKGALDEVARLSAGWFKEHSPA